MLHINLQNKKKVLKDWKNMNEFEIFWRELKFGYLSIKNDKHIFYFSPSMKFTIT